MQKMEDIINEMADRRRNTIEACMLKMEDTREKMEDRKNRGQNA